MAADRVSKVRSDYRARRTSGTRPVSGIRWIVVHDSEADLPTTGAEAVGRYFESKAAQGSTHFGVDNDTTQRYLPDNAIAWGAPGANTTGIHIEFMGKASHSRAKWLSHHGLMFKRGGWLIAHLAKKYGVPIKLLTVTEIKAGQKGIVTHALLTKALRRGTHTDPGPGFPMDLLLSYARYYRQWLPIAKRPVLKRGDKGFWVLQLKRKLAKAGYAGKMDLTSDVFGPGTEAALNAFKKAKGLPVNGIAGLGTWKALG